jgi:hypothetical protein
MMVEVDQQAEAITRPFQVILNLRAMDICQGCDRLDLNDDLVEADEVGFVLGLQCAALLCKRKHHLGPKWNPPQSQFDLQAFLVNVF